MIARAGLWCAACATVLVGLLLLAVALTLRPAPARKRVGSLLAWLLAIVSTGCALHVAPLPLNRICADGWPIKILQAPECTRGVCGYTCAPDRWRVPPPDAAPVTRRAV